MAFHPISCWKLNSVLRFRRRTPALSKRGRDICHDTARRYDSLAATDAWEERPGAQTSRYQTDEHSKTIKFNSFSWISSHNPLLQESYKNHFLFALKSGSGNYTGCRNFSYPPIFRQVIDRSKQMDFWKAERQKRSIKIWTLDFK